MTDNISDRFWHRLLKRPYTLKKIIDQGKGPEVYLIHGLGSSGDVWDLLGKVFNKKPYRLVAMDLLGFGKSPKPDWPEYNVDDHAQAVIRFIMKNRRSNKPIMIVGHSMGCLIAVRVAKLKPGLVNRLILYQMPLYAGLPDSKMYNLRKDLYFKIYSRIISRPPIEKNTKRFRSTVNKLVGLNIDPDTWTGFSKSLKNTIMEQNTLEDMRTLKIPIDVIYGRLDMVVIKGNPDSVFKNVIAPMQTYKIAQMHTISQRSSKFIAKRIIESEVNKSI